MTTQSPRQMVMERALIFAENNLKKIKVHMGRYDGSQKCHHVSRQYLEEGAETAAVTLSFVPDSGVNIHFINRIHGEFIDHTLGYLSKRNTYFLIAEHTLKELKDTLMNTMLHEEKEKMLQELFTDEERKAFGITRSHI